MLGARLIPARAGNTNQAPLTLCSHSAHPRSRGEHAPGSEGSRPPIEAHPRSRGEHYHKQAKQMRDRDSSPLARGTRSPAAPLHRNARLIPARAGNTPGLSPPRRQWSAHPRSRGEHVLLKSGSVFDSGSSPLARGTRHVGFRVGRDTRLIPARAGNTFHASQNEILSAAHPRSRGEHHRAMVSVSILFGSSPLARGTLNFLRESQRFSRLIPARAGNTALHRVQSGHRRLIPARAGNTATHVLHR